MSLSSHHTPQYILESYTEKRTTKNKDIPYIGDFVDGPDQGTPPGVWDMECTCKKLFKDEVVELKVPHTEVIKVIYTPFGVLLKIAQWY